MSARRLSKRATSFLGSILLLLAMAWTPALLAQGLPLTISASFLPPSVVSGGTATTTMTVTITNPNGFPISGIAFSDTYPAGLVADQVGAYTCNAGSALFTGSGWSLSNVTLGAGASCSVPMLMHATTIGQITNTTSQVTGTGVPPGGPASAVLSVLAPSIPVATPALTQWGLALLALMIAVFAMVRIRHAIRSSPYDERRH
jgi:hypothetical protein